MAAPRIIERTATGVLTVVVAWSFVPLLVPLVFWNNPAVVMVSLSTGVFLNPAGNAGIGSYKMSITPPELVGRVQSIGPVPRLVDPAAGAGRSAARCSPALGGPAAMAVLAGLCALVALIPTLSRTVRSVPRPAEWPRLDERRTQPAPSRSPDGQLARSRRGRPVDGLSSGSSLLTSSATSWTRSRSRQPDRSMASSQPASSGSRSSRRSRWSWISSTWPSSAASGVRNSWLIVSTSRLLQRLGAQRGLGLGGDVLDQRDRADVARPRRRAAAPRCT